MYYEVYIDRIFYLNFWINFLLLHLTAALLKERLNRLRVIAACVTVSLLDSVAICYIRFENAAWFFALQLMLCVMGAALSFSYHGIRSIFQQTLLLLLLSFLLGGICEWLSALFALSGKNIHRFVNIIAVSTVSYYALCFVIEKSKQRRCLETKRYSVMLTCGEQCLCVRALLDTGNGLREPISGKPVSILEKKEAEKLCEQTKGVLLIPYRAVGTKSGILYGFTADSMKLVGEKEEQEFFKPVIGIANEKISIKQEYEMLLNPLLFC